MMILMAQTVKNVLELSARLGLQIFLLNTRQQLSQLFHHQLSLPQKELFL
jgi:hypothetical protein